MSDKQIEYLKRQIDMNWDYANKKIAEKQEIEAKYDKAVEALREGLIPGVWTASVRRFAKETLKELGEIE